MAMINTQRSILDVLCGSSGRRLSKVYVRDAKAAAELIASTIGDMDLAPVLRHYIHNLSVWRYSGVRIQARAFRIVRGFVAGCKLSHGPRAPVVPLSPRDWNSPLPQRMLGLHSSQADQDLVNSLVSTADASSFGATPPPSQLRRRKLFRPHPVAGVRFQTPPPQPPPAPVVARTVRAATKVAADEAGIANIAGRNALDVLEEAAVNGSVAAQTALDWHASVYNQSVEMDVTAQVHLRSGARPRIRRVLRRNLRAGGGGRMGGGSSAMAGRIIRQQLVDNLIQEEAGFRYPGDPILTMGPVSVIAGIPRVFLDAVLMNGIVLHSGSWRSLLGTVYNLRDGSCVLDYIIQAVADHQFGDVNRLKYAGLDDVSIREQFGQICDVEAGVSVMSLANWIHDFNHPIGFYALDPLTMEVFAEHEHARHELMLTFVVAHGHCYPITDTEARAYLFRHKQLQPYHFGMIETDTHNFTFLSASDPASHDAIVNSTPSQEVLYTDIPLDGLMYAIAEEHYQAPSQLEARMGRVTTFVHPVTLKVVRFAEEWEARKRVCETLWQKHRCIEFSWRGQSWAKLGRCLAAIHVGQLLPSAHTKPDMVDSFGAVPLVQRIHEVEHGIAIDCRRCYTRAMYTNQEPWPVFTALDDVFEWDGQWHLGGEYYMKEARLQGVLSDIVLPAQCLSKALAEWLVTNGYLAAKEITHYRAPRMTHPAGIFMKFVEVLRQLEAEVGGKVAKPLLNTYAGCLNIRHDTKHMALMCIDYEEALCHYVRQREEGNQVNMITAEMPHANMVIVHAKANKRREEDHTPIWNQVICNATLLVLKKAVELVRYSKARLVGFKTDCILVDGVSADDIVVDDQWKLEEFGLPIRSWVPNRKLFEIEPIADWHQVTKEQVSLQESCFVTGPGGSGKTWHCMHLIAEYPGLSVLCVSFTNAAVGRMRNLLELHGADNADCCTIASALWRQERGILEIATKYDVLCVDEISMVSTKDLMGLMRHSPDVVLIVGDFNQIPPVQGGYSYDFSHTGRFREWCGLRICRLPFVPEYGRYDAQTQTILEHFLETGQLHPSMRHLRTNPSLRRNITYTNGKIKEIVGRLQYPLRAGDWVWTETGVAQVPCAERFKQPRFQAGRLVIGAYDSRECRHARKFKDHSFFRSAFYTVHTLVPGGYHLRGVEDLVVPEAFLQSADAVTAHKYQGNEVKEPFNIWELSFMSKELMYTSLSRTTKFEDIHLDYTTRVFISEKQMCMCKQPKVSEGQHMWETPDGEFHLLARGPDKTSLVHQDHPGAEWLHKTYCQTDRSCRRTLALQKGEEYVRVKKLVQPFNRCRTMKAYTIRQGKHKVKVKIGKTTLSVHIGDQVENALDILKEMALAHAEEHYSSMGRWECKREPRNNGDLALVLKDRKVDALPEPECKVPEMQSERIDAAECLKERKTLEDFCDPQRWYTKKVVPQSQAIRKGTMVVKYGNWHFRECSRDELVHMIHRSIRNGKGQLFEDMARNVRLCADLDMELDHKEPEEVVLQVVDVTNEVAMRKGVHLGREDWQYQNATRPGKLSFHIICGREVFEILSDQQSFWQDVVAVIQEQHPNLCWEKMVKRSNGKEVAEQRCIVDLAIYKSAQPMRCLFSEKKGKGNYLKPMVYAGDLQPVLAPAVTLQYISRNLCSAPPPSVYSTLAVTTRRNVPRKSRLVAREPALPLTDDTRRLLRDVKIPAGFRLSHAQECGQTIRLNRVEPSLCRCCDRVHHSDNAYLYQRGGVWFFRCWKVGAKSYAVSNQPIRSSQYISKACARELMQTQSAFVQIKNNRPHIYKVVADQWKLLGVVDQLVAV